MNEEQKAFSRAYQRNVAVASKDDVAVFFDLYMQDNPEIPMALYRWESIVDAWGIWWEARHYEEVTA
jgi:hypothetical protein